MINGVLYRIRTGVRWRDLPEPMGRGRRGTSGIAAGPRRALGNSCSSGSSLPRHGHRGSPHDLASLVIAGALPRDGRWVRS
ncbi:transposase [Streptomyces decoyicus]|nr:transposase [Streptomyces decoyicus]